MEVVELVLSRSRIFKKEAVPTKFSRKLEASQTYIEIYNILHKVYVVRSYTLLKHQAQCYPNNITTFLLNTMKYLNNHKILVFIPKEEKC